MQAVVIGAGLAGVTAAWELRRTGHAVTVLDRAAEPASETSYANAGLVCPGHAMPWAAPGVPALMLRSLFTKDQAYRLRPRLDWQMLRWGLRFLRECTGKRLRRNTDQQYRLCRYAQQRLHAVTEEAGIDYHAQRIGLLYVYRSDASFREGVTAMAQIRDMGHDMRVLDASGVREIEPAYAQAGEAIAGAVYCPTDESGDARLFTRRLADACRADGVEFEPGCTVKRINVDSGGVAGLDTSSGERRGDIYVLASGVEAPWLTRPIGIDLPIYPVKGYSVTFPVDAAHQAPLIGGLDHDRLIAFSRLGDRLRVTSVAEIAGYDTSFKPVDFDSMTAAFSELLPRAADYDSPEYWSCLRPMTPRGSPIIGRTRYDNLFLNVGHGNMGWTMSCGTARLVTDIINKRDTDIPTDALTLH